MSKKTRKLKISKNQVSASSASVAVTDGKSAIKSSIKLVPSTGKVCLSSEDLDKRYQYVKDDLKHIAIIAIPLIFILILSSFFIKI